ncbi:MAG: tRNA (5-methylaminomethyl-2-thiouridine)(34)-methyltransferase MnmD [Phenylobacterium sp.]|uniref:tRNA (5-methylaminomethyl-2-thiouridine)(34)-methyltransferase MnmD n=1 Tax=Phenylobacterium sp. TaxID=1871053 RepID=UPI00391DB50A
MKPNSPLAWTPDGQPRSRLYDDVYFSAEDGLAESRAVFLDGCGLPGAWAGRRRFVVGELGFGTGLNILALLDLWRRTRPSDARLHVFSIEAHPIEADDAVQALSRWPELADLAGLLTERWPGRARGFHRVEFPELGASLDLAVMDVEPALQAWQGCADAWFLDGFSPALNPAMWRPEIMALVAARSAPGARAATFTVAGEVRRGLQAAGFEIAKRPGFGRKRERLEAWLPAAAQPEPPARRVAVIGAGIAGASAARALRALGCEPLVFDAEGPGAGASGNPAALVTPRLDAGLGSLAALFAQGLARAARLYDSVPGAVVARGVLQLSQGPRDPERFGKIAGGDLFEPGALTLLSPEAAGERLGEPVPAALDMAQAQVVEPARILAAWTGPVRREAVNRLDFTDRGWRLVGDEERLLAEVDAVVIAAGHRAASLWPEPALEPVRGQASWASSPPAPPAAAWGGYVLPLREGVLFGATHDRGDAETELRPTDDQRNLNALAEALPHLARRLEGAELRSRASVRATTPDRLPAAGTAPGAPPGLFVLTGFGSRGFAMAPLLAEHVAALALGAPSPLPAPLAGLVDPERFRRRAARRGHDSVLPRR